MILTVLLAARRTCCSVAWAASHAKSAERYSMSSPRTTNHGERSQCMHSVLTLSHDRDKTAQT